MTAPDPSRKVKELDHPKVSVPLTPMHAQGMPERIPEAARQMMSRSERVVERDPLNASALGVSAGAGDAEHHRGQ